MKKDSLKKLLLRAAALPVTDRRWAAPLCAAALGLGLFAGVAIGPGASGTYATGVPPVIELPGLLGGGGQGHGERGEAAGGQGEAFAAGGEGESGEAIPEEAGSSAFEASFPEEEAPEEETSQAPPEKEAPTDDPEAEEPAQTIAGLVVHANPAAGSYTVVEAGGLLSAVHAAKLPAPGTKVTVPVRTLANGTFAEDGKRKGTGRRASATVAGIVTFVDADPAAPAYAVSKRGVSMLIRVRPDPAGAAPTLPALGAYATVSVEIEKPLAGAGLPPAAAPAPGEAVVAPAPPADPTCAPDPAQPVTVPAPPAILWQQKLDADGAPFASGDFAGVVTAICAGEGELALSGDDLRQAGEDILFAVPKTIDIGALEVGDSVAATAAIETDGTLRLSGLASDERVKGADDAKAAQGELASQTPK
jgi:hypothetical protein